MPIYHFHKTSPVPGLLLFHMTIILFFVLHWYISLFFQSVFHHRYAAHRHFTMTRNWEKVFHIGSFITQGSSYISAYSYGIMHRLHHEHTDTEADPHSPTTHPNFWSMMLQTRNNYISIFRGETSVPEKIKKDLPRWDAFDKIAHNWLTRVGWMILYAVIYMQFATAWWQYILLPFTIITGTLQGAVVNWWAHKFGYTNFVQDNTSKNIIPFDFIFWGESYHNNHHRYPGRVNYAHRWFEFDMGYYALRIMDKLKIVQLNRSAAAAKKSPA